MCLVPLLATYLCIWHFSIVSAIRFFQGLTGIMVRSSGELADLSSTLDENEMVRLARLDV